jgi:hypothetical protein
MNIKRTKTSKTIVKEIFSIEIDRKTFVDEIENSHPLKERDNLEEFVERILNESELDVIDLIFDGDDVKIIVEKII